MTKVSLGLTSTDGDRLGHLVRGVQMLRSYGNEMEVDRYSDVIDAAVQADAPAALCCVLTGESDATLDGLRGICRETEWALGDDERVLNVTILRYGDDEPNEGARPLQAVLRGRFEPGMTRLVSAEEFARMCDWGQQLSDTDADIIGEWPSATGR